jgi:hypothetical protein
MKEHLRGEARSALEGAKERHVLGGVSGLSIRARSFIFVGFLSMKRLSAIVMFQPATLCPRIAELVLLHLRDPSTSGISPGLRRSANK